LQPANLRAAKAAITTRRVALPTQQVLPIDVTSWST
jgi:hypothetical protein